MKQNLKNNLVPLLDAGWTRRTFLSRAARGTTLAALFGGLPRSWVGNVYASDAPETADVRFGMIALTDCSPIVIAHEKGFFKKYGINATVSKGANWAAIRDSLSSGPRLRHGSADTAARRAAQRARRPYPGQSPG